MSYQKTYGQNQIPFNSNGLTNIGERPQGYTLHHSEISGQMELVPRGAYNVYNHNGGRSLNHWAYREGGR